MMARKSKIEAPGFLRHITARAIERRILKDKTYRSLKLKTAKVKDVPFLSQFNDQILFSSCLLLESLY